MIKVSKTKNAPAAFAETPVNPPADSFLPSSGLQLLFEENIKCLYWIENHLVKSLPKMISSAGNPGLKKALTTHLKLTVGHAERLVKVFGMLNRDVLSKKSDAMEGLAMDGEHIIEEPQAGSPERNTGLIMAGRLVENYEMTDYKGVIQLADQLGLTDISGILNETLIEEQQADNILSELSEKKNSSLIIPIMSKSSAGKEKSMEETAKTESLRVNTETPENEFMTTNHGTRINDDQNSLKAGPRGGTLLEDFILREKITHFDHERIPERVVHARGSAAHGIFKVYKPFNKYTKAGFLNDTAIETPVFVRFSTVGRSPF